MTMEYITYDEMPDSNISESIAKIKKQIETNLFNIHNKFAKNSFEDVLDIYDALEFGLVDEKDTEIFEPFMITYDHFIGLQYCYEIETEEVLSQYQEIEEELKENLESLV